MAKATRQERRALRRWRRDPVAFIREILRGEPWSRQVEVLESLVENAETNVVSGHGVGKDWLGGHVVPWWVGTREGIVLTTAPKRTQVDVILWGEVRAALERAVVPIGGELLPVEPLWRFGPKWYAIGMTGKDVNALQGFHGRNVLAILDEAAGLSEFVFEAVESCAGGDNDRILRIGNPKCGPTHPFAKACREPDEPGVRKTIRIKTTENPNCVEGREVIPGLNGRKWVERQARKYGRTSNVYKALVEAVFPPAAADGLIGYEHLQAARDRAGPMFDDDVARIGCDVARFGDDLTIIWVVRGGYAWIPTNGIMSKARGPEIARRLLDIASDVGAVSIAIDVGGVGSGVVDSLFEIDHGLEVYPNDFGARASNPAEWSNRRTELWWRMRDWLRDEAAIEIDELLEEELIAPTYRWSGRAKILEPKEKIKARLGRSPDRADGLALAACGHVGATFEPPKVEVW